MGTAVHSIGLADWLTIGFQAEGAKDLVMGGAGFHAKLWRLGTFGAEGLPSARLPSDQGNGQGYAATGLYSFMSNWFSTEMRGDLDRAGVPEPLSRTGRPGADQRRRVGLHVARLVWFAHGRRDAGRSGCDHWRVSHKSIRISSAALPDAVKTISSRTRSPPSTISCCDSDTT